MKPDDFLKKLKPPFPGVTVCVGDEPFFKEEVFRGFQAALRKGNPSADTFSFAVDAGEPPARAAHRLVAELSTGGLFSATNLYLVRRGSSLLKEAAPLLLDLMDRSMPNPVLFFADGLDGRTRFAKKLKEKGGYVECRKLYTTTAPWRVGLAEETELDKWAAARSASFGLRLSREAVSFLTSLTGNDLFLLDSELHKLSLVLPAEEEPMGLKAIEEATGLSAVHTPFDLWDRIEEGDGPGALAILAVIVRNGLRSTGGRLETDSSAIAAILLGLFRERIRMSSQVALLLWEKASDREIMDRLSIRSVYYLNKLKHSARKIRASTLKKVGQTLLNGDRRIKRSGFPAVPVMEETVLRLAEAVR